MTTTKTPYPITRDTELMIALAMTTSSRFYQMVGHAIDPERMPTPASAILVWAAKRVAFDRSGEGCVDPGLAMQEIRTGISGGVVDTSMYNQAIDLLDDALAAGGVSDVEVLIQQTVPLAQYGHVQEVTDSLLKALGGTSPMNAPRVQALVTEHAHKLQKASDIGRYAAAKVSEGIGDANDINMVMANSAFGGFLMPTGIPEMDQALGGGTERGTFNLVIAGTGVGKTGYLCHQFVTAVEQGFEGVYFSFESEIAEIKSKVYRSLVDMTRSEMQASPAEAVRRFQMQRAAGVARFWVVKMPPGTPLNRVLRELENIKRDHKADVRMVMFDYLDKMTGTKDMQWADVETMADTIREQVSIAIDGWSWSGSQRNKGSSGASEEPITCDDARGGAGKTHGCDLAVGGRRTKEDKLANCIRFDIAKRRIGDGEGAEIGPLIRDVERGRIVMVSKVFPWTGEDPSKALVGKNVEGRRLISIPEEPKIVVAQPADVAELVVNLS